MSFSTIAEIGIDSAEKRAREEGREEGRAEGRAEAILATARNMKSLGLSVEIIQQTTGLSLKEIEEI